MSARRKVIGRFVLIFLAAIMISSRGRSQGEAGAEMHVVIVGFADRWADYGELGTAHSNTIYQHLLLMEKRGRLTRLLSLRSRNSGSSAKEPGAAPGDGLKKESAALAGQQEVFA